MTASAVQHEWPTMVPSATTYKFYSRARPKKDGGQALAAYVA